MTWPENPHIKMPSPLSDAEAERERVVFGQSTDVSNKIGFGKRPTNLSICNTTGFIYVRVPGVPTIVVLARLEDPQTYSSDAERIDAAWKLLGLEPDFNYHLTFDALIGASERWNDLAAKDALPPSGAQGLV